MAKDETVPATADAGPLRSRLYRPATGLLTRSFALAAAGAAIVFAVNHNDALLHLELSQGQALQAGLSFLTLVGHVSRGTPAEAAKPGTARGVRS